MFGGTSPSGPQRGATAEVPNGCAYSHLQMAGKAGPTQLRRLLDATLAIGSELSLNDVLRRIAEAATELVGARYGALGVLAPDGNYLSDFITVGVDDAVHAQIGELPKGHGILGLLIHEQQPIRLPDLQEHPESFGFPAHHPQMQSFLGVPIRVRGTVFGNLYLCDKVNGEAFSDIDEELAVSLGVAAGVAIDNARLHAAVAEFALVEDRERIARDLHDTVIQRLFACGLTLQSTIALIGAAAARERLTTVVADLDETIREIRSAIFELHTSRLPGRSTRTAILELCHEASRALSFEPIVRFEGPVDGAVEGPLTDAVLAVARELLSNIAQHAHATSVMVAVEVAAGMLTLTVRDDGRGIPEGHVPGQGLENAHVRSKKLGGVFRISANIQGTTAVWQVPCTGARH